MALAMLFMLAGLTAFAADAADADYRTVWMATWDGRIYMMCGHNLLMLDQHLAVRKSVDMPSHGGDAETDAGLQICADNRGVYLLQRGYLTIFDHNLDVVSAGPLPEQVTAQLTAPNRYKQTGDYAAQTLWSQSKWAEIPKGSVELQYSPPELVPGRVALRVRVIKFPKQLDSRATISGAIGPKGNTGDYITFRRTGRGEYMTTADLPEATVYELKLRIERGPATVDNISFYLDLTT
jgi:hypothetical protein